MSTGPEWMLTLLIISINARSVPSIKPNKQSSECSWEMYPSPPGKTLQLTFSQITTHSTFKIFKSSKWKLQILIFQYGPPKRLFTDIRPPFSIEAVTKFLSSQHIGHTAQKTLQKKPYDCRHNVRPLPELNLGQPVLFLSPTDSNSYIEGTITGSATTARSYMIEAHGRVYCCTRQHIWPININTPTPFTRPSTHQDNCISRPSTHQDTPITWPSMHQDNSFTRPSSRTLPQIDALHQQDSTKLSKHSCIPTLQCPATHSCHPATHCAANIHPQSTSCIPTLHCSPFQRPIDHSSNPFSRLTNHSPSPIARPLVPTPYDIYQFLTLLTAINGYPAIQQDAVDLIPESLPDFPAFCNSSESSKPIGNSQKSTSSDPDNDSDMHSTSPDDTQSTSSETSTQSTASSRTL